MRYLRYLSIVALMFTLPAMAQDAAGPGDMESIISMANGGDTNGALQALDNLLADDPDNLEALYYQGLLRLEQEDTSGARQAFQRIADIYPDAIQAPVLNNLALTYAQDGELQRARTMLLSAIARDPDYATAQSNLGDIYIRLAVEAYREADRLYGPDDGDGASSANQAKLEYLEELFQEP